MKKILHYEIDDKLGEGSMGEVFAARDINLNRSVALKKLIIDESKKIDPAQLEEVRVRFLQEAQAAARLNHPNIMTIYQVIREDSADYIAMELLEGKTLADWLQDGRVFTLPEIIKIASQIAEALDYAHKMGVVHRDIKPDNIFLSSRDLKVKITDFGIARVETDALVKTSIGTFMGTPAYSSPEQWKDSSAVDGRADLYSTGIILYRLITGKLPFDGSNLNELITQILRSQPTPIKTLVPSMPDELEAVVMKSIEKDPSKRYSTGAELAEALKAAESSVDSLRKAETVSIMSDDISPGDGKESDSIAEPGTLVLKDLNFDDYSWVKSVIEGWHVKDLPAGRFKSLLDKLLDNPVHADPFSGALEIDKRYIVLIWNGIILEAFDLELSKRGEAVMNGLPVESSSYVLRTPVEEKAKNIPVVLSTALNKHEPLHKDIDSSIIDVAGLIRKLSDEDFSGAVRFKYDEGYVYLGFYRGSRVFILQSKGLELDISSTIMADLTNFVKVKSFKADVYRIGLEPLRASVRRLFKDTRISVVKVPDSDLTHTTMVKRKNQDYHPRAVAELRESLKLDIEGSDKDRKISIGLDEHTFRDILQEDFVMKVLDWFLYRYFLNIVTSGNTQTLKYIATWVSEIKTIHINHTLKGDDGRDHTFDIVTTDKKGKVLHIIHMGRDGELETLKDFLDEVISAKKYLIKSGDIGGVILVSPQVFTDETTNYYHEETAERKKEFGIGSLDSVTGYKGFIRIGQRRGFHLSLVTYIDDRFTAVGPVL